MAAVQPPADPLAEATNTRARASKRRDANTCAFMRQKNHNHVYACMHAWGVCITHMSVYVCGVYIYRYTLQPSITGPIVCCTRRDTLRKLTDNHDPLSIAHIHPGGLGVPIRLGQLLVQLVVPAQEGPVLPLDGGDHLLVRQAADAVVEVAEEQHQVVLQGRGWGLARTESLAPGTLALE